MRLNHESSYAARLKVQKCKARSLGFLVLQQ